MEMGFVEKTKGFLLNPTESFKQVKDENMGTALKYFVIWLLIYSALFAIIMGAIGGMMASLIPAMQNIPLLGAGTGLMAAVSTFVMLLIGGIIGIFIGAGIIHIGVLIVGGKKGYGQTLKALVYGGTPSYVLGWIPVVGMIAGIWALIVEILGIKELHEVSTGRAIIAVIIPIVIIAVIFMVIAATMFVYVSSLMPSGGIPTYP